jgi:hypothetical protein
MTEEVAAELIKLEQQADEDVYRNAHERQQLIAKTCGTDGRVMDKNSGLRLVAQIDAGVYSYWELREGKQFWTQQGELKRMLKKHPELAVQAKTNQFSFSTTSTGNRRRGRWAP